MAKFPLILLVITTSEESSTSGSKYFGIKDMTVFIDELVMKGGLVSEVLSENSAMELA